ncbi:hypothetical protein AMAG_19187 [Allomyces macrogynus ATCC 38327]|uniref:Uncharacterized protein n=1 Tax=Allomyces macrogynus (strain ATCC 38327) TaxID=578462 RepID=A0A0L0ST87_ALLM3|nr:hypothetical protein AMAG_19187 [Allomyces macrogynus ATCC 38327]|eukprot:KNE65595.1 hypothetical protein AMAG_19187 [Allomyces macrogynus ATCC 38327]
MSGTRAAAAAAAVADVPADGDTDQAPCNAGVSDFARVIAPLPVLPPCRPSQNDSPGAVTGRPLTKTRPARRVSRSPSPSPPLYSNMLKVDGRAPPPPADQLVLFGGRHLRSPTDDLITGTVLWLPPLAEDVVAGNDGGCINVKVKDNADSSDRSSGSESDSDSDDDDASPPSKSTMSLPSLASTTADTPARGTTRSTTRIPGGRGRARITLSVPSLLPSSRGAPERTVKPTSGPANVTFHAASLLSLDDQLRVGALTRRVPWLGNLFRRTPRTSSTKSPSLLARAARSMWPASPSPRTRPRTRRP